MNRKCLARLVGAAAIVLGAASASTAGAQVSDAAREAGQHFRRGVELYSEANYAGALVEFKRAYVLAASSTALYDIGETQFQLQDYAGALQTFKTFLTQYGASENHHAEVEAGVQVLATRVGHLRVTTLPRGAEVAVDDEPVGRTPMAEPVLVSVGHRKVVASMPGREPVTRYIDVAAGDDASIAITLPEPVEAPPPAAVAAPVEAVAPAPRGPALRASPTLRAAGWIATGALAAVAGGFGILAIHESADLRQSLRELQPAADPTGTVDREARLTQVFAGIADSLAAAAVVVGGLSLYLTIASTASEHESSPAARVGVGPASVRFDMTF